MTPALPQTIRPPLAAFLLFALAALVSACGNAADRTGSSTATAADGSRVESRRKPLPDFSGFTLDGKRFSVRDDVLGQRTLLFFFNPEVDEAKAAGTAVARIAALRADHNFRIAGIALGSNADTTRNYAKTHGLDFPIVEDTSGSIAGTLRLRSRVLLLGIDPEGDIAWAEPGEAPGAPDPIAAIETSLRESLRLPESESGIRFAERSEAAMFEARQLGSDEPLRLTDYAGRPIVLIFFLHTCPHCHETLHFLKSALPKIPEDKRPALIAVSVANRPVAVEAELKKEKLDFFPVVFDPDSTIRNDYGVFGGVPDTFLIDREGRIAERVKGFDERRDAALMRMWMAKLAGSPIPMLLHNTGFSGNDACAVCHQEEHETWRLTQHSGAWSTLVRHGADTDGECISCHVVGWGEKGGFELAAPSGHLENVGCESCHGRGGPHLSPEFVADGNYETVCRTCHNPTHSLGFEFGSFLPKISHAANRPLLALSPEEKEKLLEERGLPRDPLAGATASYVGSQACESCHSAEFATWSQSPHAKSIESLAAKNEANNADCLRCHTTGFGRGGFPDDAKPADQPDLARVGCESCHGPGSDHIGENANRVGTIISLTDKCDSCVILQICGGCHDDANDPGFEFSVEEKIERQRHGTITPAAAKRAEQASAQEHDTLTLDLAFRQRPAEK